jgi:hypothetical protein
MPAGEVHINDNLMLQLTVQDGGAIQDLSNASVKNITFQKPDGTTYTKPVTFFTNGQDGVVVYTMASGELDTQGFWRYQVKVLVPSGTFSTDINSFKVYENLF